MGDIGEAEKGTVRIRAELCHSTGNSEQVAELGCEPSKGVRLSLECVVYKAAELGGVKRKSRKERKQPATKLGQCMLTLGELEDSSGTVGMEPRIRSLQMKKRKSRTKE